MSDTDETPLPRRPRTWFGLRKTLLCFVGVPIGIVVLTTLLVIPFVPRLDSRGSPTTRCARHMRALLPYVLQHHQAMLERAVGSDAPILLALHGHEVPPGSEEIFTCPGDAAVGEAVGRRNLGRYGSEDVMDGNDGQPLCSFAVRDFDRFPLEGDGPHWILCDRQGHDGRTAHHPGRLTIGLSDGTLIRQSVAELGLAAGEPIVVGPGSRHPELRKMIFVSSE